MQTTDVTVGIMVVELHIEDSRSLKDKRMVLNRIKARLKNRPNTAVAELDHQEAWQRSAVVVVAIGTSEGALDRQLDEARAENDAAGVLVTREEREFR
jgi:uncharacterized protein YlxP (DUF503 family)